MRIPEDGYVVDWGGAGGKEIGLLRADKPLYGTDAEVRAANAAYARTQRYWSGLGSAALAEKAGLLTAARDWHGDPNQPWLGNEITETTT